MSEIDAKIDQLYQRPLGEFVAARNALAKGLQKADAERVRRLPKPAAGAWLINQLYWRGRSAYDRLCEAGARLRAAQVATLEGRPADLCKATDLHHKAIADAVQVTKRIAAAAKVAVSPESLARTLDALSLATGPQEAPGRLVEAPEPAGFEVLAGVRPRPTPVVAEESAARTPRDGSGEENNQRRVAAAALQEAETLGKQLAQRMADAQRRESLAREGWERAKQEVDDVKAELDRATAAIASARQRLEKGLR